MRIICGVFLLVTLCLFPAISQEKSIRLGKIDFFGYDGFDPATIRASLPVHEGDAIAAADLSDTLVRLRMAIRQTLGKPATDIATDCCDDHGELMIYIGLPGKSSTSPTYNLRPNDSIQLPSAIIDLYEQATALAFEAAQAQPAEVHLNGYALSTFPPLRAKQLATREYALHAEGLLIDVLTKSSQAEHRRAAAYVLGYGQQSKRQADVLVSAASDIDDEVRGNAVRALTLLVESNSKIGAQIPPAKFITMLNSGLWKDRAKAALLLETLSRTHDPRLLKLIHKSALTPLVEMARWRNALNAYPARVLLARVAGMKENQVQQLVHAGQSQAIIDSVRP